MSEVKNTWHSASINFSNLTEEQELLVNEMMEGLVEKINKLDSVETEAGADGSMVTWDSGSF